MGFLVIFIQKAIGQVRPTRHFSQRTSPNEYPRYRSLPGV